MTTEFTSTCPVCGERYLDYCKHCDKEEKARSKQRKEKDPEAFWTEFWGIIIGWGIIFTVIAILYLFPGIIVCGLFIGLFYFLLWILSKIFPD
jgi:Flp pilus assembly protein TadB